MNVSDKTTRTLRTLAITSLIVIVPLATYHFGYRAHQVEYHNQRFARQLDLVARRFRESLIYMQKAVAFEHQERASDAWRQLTERKREMDEAAARVSLTKERSAAMIDELSRIEEDLARHNHDKEQYLSQRFKGRLYESRFESEAAEEPFAGIVKSLEDRRKTLETNLKAYRIEQKQLRDAESAYAIALEKATLDVQHVKECPKHLLACRTGRPFQRLVFDLKPGATCDASGTFVTERSGPEVQLAADYSDDPTHPCLARIPLADLAFQGDVEQTFDAVVLVDSDGTVLAQSSGSLPRMTQIAPELFDSAIRLVDRSSEAGAGKADPASSLSSLFGSNRTPTTDVAGVSYRVFRQAVHLPLGRAAPAASSVEADRTAKRLEGDDARWAFVGLLAEPRFASEIGPRLDFLAIAMLFIVLFVLAWPFLRLRLIGPNDPIYRSDLLFVLVALLLGVALVAAAVIDVSEWRAERHRIDGSLADTAGVLEAGFDRELRTALATLRSATLEPPTWTSPAGESEASRRRQPCFPAASGKTAPPYATLFWLDASGSQSRCQVTYRVAPALGMLKLAGRDYFRRIRDGETWSLEPSATTGDTRRGQTVLTLPPFYVERIVSWKEGTKETAISIDVRAIDPEWEEHGAIAAVLLKRFETLRRPVLPLGTGYAVIDPDGLVLYHSDDSLSLAENFLVEASPRRRFEAAIDADVGASIAGSYHGDPHRFHVTPLSGVPWTLVVFADERYLQVAWFQYVITVATSLIVLTVVLLLGLLLARLAGWKLRMKWIWPRAVDRDRYWLAAALAALLAAAALSLMDLDMPPASAPHANPWHVAAVLVLLIASGWTIAAEGLRPRAPGGEFVPADGRAVVLRRLLCFVPLLGAAALAFAFADVRHAIGPIGVTAFLGASAVGARLVYWPAEVFEEGFDSLPPIHRAHLSMLAAYVVLIAVVPVMLLRADGIQTQMTRLARASAISIARSIDGKAREVLRDGERYCFEVEWLGKIEPGEKVRHCTTFAQHVRDAKRADGLDPRSDRVLRDRIGPDATASDRADVVTSTVSIALRALTPRPRSPSDDRARVAALRFGDAHVEDVGGCSSQEERAALWSSRLTGFVASMVSPFDAVSTQTNGYLVHCSTSQRWRAAIAANAGADVRAAGRETAGLDEVSAAYCPEASPCFTVAQPIDTVGVPARPQDRAVLAVLSIGAIGVLAWGVSYARRRLVGDGVETSDRRRRKTWLIHGAWMIPEPALRAALAASSRAILRFEDRREHAKAAELLHFADLEFDVLVIPDVDRLLLDEPGVRGALRSFLESRLEPKSGSYARDVVLVSGLSRETLAEELRARVGGVTASVWGDLLGRCTTSTRSGHVQLWLDSEPLLAREAAADWFGLMGGKFDAIEWKDPAASVAELASPDVLGIERLDLALLGPAPPSALHEELLRRLDLNAKQPHPGDRAAFAVLTSPIDSQQLRDVLEATAGTWKPSSPVLAQVVDVRKLGLGQAKAAADADSAAELLELERAWQPELGSAIDKVAKRLHGGVALSVEQAAEQVADLASLYFDSVLAQCSTEEKLALHHLASGYMLNPANEAVIESLLQRRLIRRAPDLRIALPSFETYVRSVSTPDRVRVWRAGFSSRWRDLRVPLAAVVVVAAILIVIAGGESTVAMVSGLAAGIPAVTQLISRLLPVRTGGA